MHGEEIPLPQTMLKETAWDDERRFEYMKNLLSNRSLLDFGCGAGGFLLRARNLGVTAHGVELETGLRGH